MASRIFAIAIALLLIWACMRYLERRSIYYPARKLESTPAAVGLDYEDVFFEASDGIRLNGWFIPARGAEALLLFCHGNAGNISHRLEIIEIFNKIGLNVFIFDYRGYGKSEGRPSEKGTYLDAMAAYDYLISRQTHPIVIYGKSLGAVIAVDLAQKVKAAALIIESAFTSTLDMASEIYPFLPVRFMVRMKYGALSKIKNIDVPKLIIHSKDDEIIPFRHGQRLFEAANEPKEFYQMRGGHNEATLMAPDEFGSKIEAFLRKYL